jgi:hypothetical protein
MGPGFRQDDVAETSPFDSELSCERKRSNPHCLCGNTLDCFIASLLAMTAERHAFPFSRRNPPELCSSPPSGKARGCREGRVAAAPGALAQKKCASAKTTGTAVITPAFPAQSCYGLYALFPVNHSVCHRRPADHQIRKTWRQTSGRQNHTTSPSASAPLVSQRFHVHRIPASRIVTVAKRPLQRGGTIERKYRFSENNKRNIFRCST